MQYLIGQHPKFVFQVNVGAPIDVGVVAGRRRRYIPILGGSVLGEHQGTILAGGGDWQNILPDGTLELQARYVVSIEDVLIEVRSDGVRSGPPEVLEQLSKGEAVSPNDYYFRTAIRLVTASPRFAHWNGLLFVGIGERLASQVRLAVHQVL